MFIVKMVRGPIANYSAMPRDMNTQETEPEFQSKMESSSWISKG